MTCLKHPVLGSHDWHVAYLLVMLNLLSHDEEPVISIVCWAAVFLFLELKMKMGNESPSMFLLLAKEEFGNGIK